MPAPPHHIHVSEQQPGPDFDCTWCAGVMWLRQVFDVSIPPTHDEADRLRAASGDTGTSNLSDLRRGIKARYGWTPPLPVYGWTKIAGVYQINDCAVIQGRLTAWPLGNHYRRWYPNFTGGHATFTYRFSQSEVWWDDPGAPPPDPKDAHPDYNGEPMSWGDLAHFNMAGGPDYGALIAPRKENDLVPVSDTTPHLLTFAAGTKLFDLNGTTVATYDAPRTNVYSPFAITADHLAVVRVWNGQTQLGYISKAQAKSLLIRSLPEDCSQEIAADRAKARIVYG